MLREVTGQNERKTLRSILRDPGDFNRLWGAQTISRLGDEVSLVAVPTAAVLLLNASALQVGLLTAAGFVGYPLLGLTAGFWIDRVRRRRLLLAADLTRAVALGCIPVASRLHHAGLGLLFAAALITGIATAVFNSAYEAYVPSVVSQDRRTWAYRRLGMTSGAAEVIGPAMGGEIVQALGAYLAFALDALSFAASACGIASIRSREPKPQSTGGETTTAAFSAGWRFVWHHKLLRRLVVSSAVINFGRTLKVTMLVLFLYRGLGLNPSGAGLVLALGSVGALVGAPCTAMITRITGAGRVFILAAFGQGVFWLTVPLAALLPHGLGIALVGSLSGFFIPVWNINVLMLRQAVVPNDLRARVAVVARSVGWVTIPLSSLIAGSIAGILIAWWGNRAGLICVMEISGLIWTAAALALPIRLLWRTDTAEELYA